MDDSVESIEFWHKGYACVLRPAYDSQVGKWQVQSSIVKNRGFSGVELLPDDIRYEATEKEKAIAGCKALLKARIDELTPEVR